MTGPRPDSDSKRVEGERHGSALAPALSVIVTTPDSCDTVRDLIGALRAQTAQGALELVIVVPEAARIQAAELDGFGCWQIVELPNMTSVAQAKAAGVRCARAPLVVLTEDHSFPEPQWAQALIDAHRGDYAAVGPAMYNANPDSQISWADFIVGYGPWLDPPAAGEADSLPGHNTSYKRDLLLGYDDRLEALLSAETLLHQELRASGQRLYLEPAAKTAHLNFTDVVRWVPYLFYSGRLFAAQRAKNWGSLRQAAYSAGAPLIPLVRFKRLLPAVGRANFPFVPWLYATLLFALTVDAAGQCIGYITGAGRAAQNVARLEYHRGSRKLHAPVSGAQSQP